MHGLQSTSVLPGRLPLQCYSGSDDEIEGVDLTAWLYRRIFEEIADRFDQEMMGSLDMETGAASEAKAGGGIGQRLCPGAKAGIGLMCDPSRRMLR